LRELLEKRLNGLRDISDLKKLIFAIFLIALILVVGFYSFGQSVPPGYMGVRRIGFGPWAGFHQQALKPGFHWSLPLASYTTIHLIPSTVQSVKLSRASGASKDEFGPVAVQTANGAQVIVDATALVRFVSEPKSSGDQTVSGGPVDLIESVGREQSDWFRWIKRNVEDELKRALGSLSTAEFYNPDLRDHGQVRTAEKKVAEVLAPYGIELVSLLLGRYIYEAEEINQAIARKNLQDQEERLNTTRGNFAEVAAQLRQREADLDAQIKTLAVEGETNALVIRSEGDLYETQMRAKGELLVAQASAKSDAMRSEALSSGPGSDVYVARQLAPILSALKGGLITDLDPFDLKALIERLGVDPADGENRAGVVDAN